MSQFTKEDVSSVEVLRGVDDKPEMARIAFDNGSVYLFRVERTDGTEELIGIGECLHAATYPVFDEAGEATHEYRCSACGKTIH